MHASPKKINVRKNVNSVQFLVNYVAADPTGFNNLHLISLISENIIATSYQNGIRDIYSTNTKNESVENPTPCIWKTLRFRICLC